MGAVAAVAMIAGSTAFSASSKVSAGKYSQQVANVNAEVAGIKGEQTIQRGYEQEAKLRGEVRRMVGTARAAYAGQGVDVNVGTAADVQTDIQVMGELDALTLRNNAAREAWGYKVEAYNYRAQGGLDRYTGNVGATSTILGGLSSMYGARSFGGGSSGGMAAPVGYANMGVGNAPRGMG
jgi:hypothetical protein